MAPLLLARVQSYRQFACVRNACPAHPEQFSSMPILIYHTFSRPMSLTLLVPEGRITGVPDTTVTKEANQQYSYNSKHQVAADLDPLA